jgi:hypothetical protein
MSIRTDRRTLNGFALWLPMVLGFGLFAAGYAVGERARALSFGD